MTETRELKLGLIGDNIARSKSPLLHRLAGAQNGLTVRYDRLIPRDMGRASIPFSMPAWDAAIGVST